MAKRNKSALKANRQNIKRREANRRMRSKLRTGLKSLRKSIASGDQSAAKTALGETQSLVDRMAATFTKTNGDLRAVMDTLLFSREFLSEGAWQAKVKTPLELVASALRALGGEVTDSTVLAQQLTDMGQPLYGAIPPTGYLNTAEAWSGSAGQIRRMSFANALASGQIGGVKVNYQMVDESGTVDQVATNFRRLVLDDKVDAVVGYTSSANCLAVASVAEELKKLTVIHICGTYRLFEEGKYKYVVRSSSRAFATILDFEKLVSRALSLVDETVQPSSAAIYTLAADGMATLRGHLEHPAGKGAEVTVTAATESPVDMSAMLTQLKRVPIVGDGAAGFAVPMKLEGKPVDWLEHVTPEQYAGRSGGS